VEGGSASKAEAAAGGNAGAVELPEEQGSSQLGIYCDGSVADGARDVAMSRSGCADGTRGGE